MRRGTSKMGIDSCITQIRWKCRSLSGVCTWFQSIYIPLSDEEAQAILYHDGQYILENRVIAHKECPLTLLLTFADTWTTAVNEEGREVKENKNYFKR